MKKTLSIAHLSDLHLTTTDGGRRKQDGAREMNANFGRILTQPVVREADLVLITGDISDRGELAA
jgi:3',5'-cyclic AMP phosphodiesterase CpdA